MFRACFVSIFTDAEAARACLVATDEILQMACRALFRECLRYLLRNRADFIGRV